MEWREKKNPQLSAENNLTKVLMSMVEYVEGCMVNDGNYSYMNGKGTWLFFAMVEWDWL